MLETLMRLTLPMPAARSALSNAFSAVPPSAVPAVIEALVTCFQNIATSLRAAPTARAASSSILSLAPAGRHHHWRESKTQAFFPCAVSLVLYNSADFRPESHRRREVAATACTVLSRRRRSAMIDAGRGRGRRSGLESLGRHLLLELYDCSS